MSLKSTLSPFEKAKEKRNTLVRNLQDKYISAIVIFRKLTSDLRLNNDIVEEILDKLYLFFRTQSLTRKCEKTIIGVLTYTVSNAHDHYVPQATVAHHLGIDSQILARNRHAIMAKLDFYNAL